jgi:Trypsin-like peptidase domain/FG-GAP-like repeat
VLVTVLLDEGAHSYVRVIKGGAMRIRIWLPLSDVTRERQAKRYGVYVVAALAAAWSGCESNSRGEETLPAEGLGETSGQVVYGVDDRRDVYAHTNATLRARARQATVALMSPQMINSSNPSNFTFNALSLQQGLSLCNDQRFLADPMAARCSGTLIDDDLVLTAGHCITTSQQCSDTRFVFRFYRPGAGAMASIVAADVFSCASLVVRQFGTVDGRHLDYAVVRLDRSAAPRFLPAPVRSGNAAMTIGQGVSVIGTGSGIPFKIDSGGVVRDGRATVLDYFVANTDTFAGNSGSGVYENGSFDLVGVLVGGEDDYVWSGGCRVVNVCPATGCRGEDIAYVGPAIEAYCANAESTRLCNSPPPPTAFLPAGSWTPAAYGAAPNGWYVGDFNGDGRSDLFRYSPPFSGAEMFLSNGESFAQSGSWTSATYGGAPNGWYVGDFNGDGRSDIFRYIQPSSGAEVFLSSGSAFIAAGSWTIATYGGAPDGWYVGDFNGDGKSDIFRYAPPSGAEVFLSNGSSFVAAGSWTSESYGAALGGWYVGDFNGDGMSDIFRYVPGVSGAEVFLSNGGAFVRSGSWTGAHYGVAPSGWYVGDFNGDGKSDIFRYVLDVSGAEVFLSSGTSFVAAGSWTPAGYGSAPKGWYVGDFNGDRRNDVFRYMPGVSGAEVFLSRR